MSPRKILPCRCCGVAPRAFGNKRYCVPCGPLVAKENARRRNLKRIDQVRDRARRHYWDNRESVLAKRRSPEGRAQAKARDQRRRESPARRLYMNTSRSIRAALAGTKGGRSWEGLLGFTLADLMAHLERQFVRGMTWANMGEWEVDHIRPRRLFDMADPVQFKDCWSLTNLRPLWREQNQAKSGHRMHLL